MADQLKQRFDQALHCVPRSYTVSTLVFGAVFAVGIAVMSVPVAQANPLDFAVSAGGKDRDIAHDVAIDRRGNIYVTGNFEGTATFGEGGDAVALNSVGGSDVFVARYGRDGALRWAIRAGGNGRDEGRGIATDRLGNVYVSGAFQEIATFGQGDEAVTLTTTGFDDIFVAKYGRNGTLRWATSSGGPYPDGGLDIATDHRGNAYVTGFFNEMATFGAGETAIVLAGSDIDIFIAKYGRDGTPQWATGGGGDDFDFGYGIATDRRANVYVTGAFTFGVTFGDGDDAISLDGDGEPDDMFVVSFDSKGKVRWAINGRGGEEESEEGRDITTDHRGNTYATGHFSGTVTFGDGDGTVSLTSTGGVDIFVLSYSRNGELRWATSAGGTDSDRGSGITTGPRGNIYVTGGFHDTATFDESGKATTLESTGAADAFVAKYGRDGSFRWAVSAGSGDDEEGFDIATDRRGNSYVTGFFHDTATLDEDGNPVTLTSAGEEDAFLARYNRRKRRR